MARGRKSSLRMVLSPEERDTFEHWQRSTTIAAGLASPPGWHDGARLSSCWPRGTPSLTWLSR
jgi:hypothetical protein